MRQVCQCSQDCATRQGRLDREETRVKRVQILEIIKNIKQQPSTEAKLLVLEQNKDNELLKRILALTYDVNRFQFGFSVSTFKRLVDSIDVSGNLVQGATNDNIATAVRMLENSPDRLKLTQLVSQMPREEQQLIEAIVSRDLGLGLTAQELKVEQQLPYMRPSLTTRAIKLPAFVQPWFDEQSYRQIDVFDDVTIRTRWGKDDLNLRLRSVFLHAPKGTYIGSIKDAQDDEKVTFTAWDFLPPIGASRDLDNLQLGYRERFELLQQNLPKSDCTKVVLTRIVSTIPEIKELAQRGSIVVKDFRNKFRNGVTQTQLFIPVSQD